ncbi:MAG: RuBisCO large subunit C-terminal-like domain-containing protein [Pseudomonadota bacterium]
MSSENLHGDDQDSFLWQSEAPPHDYVLATYLFSTPIDGEQAALGIAREQSICATSLQDVDIPADIVDFCAKVISVEASPDASRDVADRYFLNTPVYGPDSKDGRLLSFRATIAYPLRLFDKSLTRLWNSVFGEVHRLGYLGSVTLLDLQLPDAYVSAFPGPRYGISGIREKLGVTDRPIFCRSMRPASGLSTQAMLQLNERVLSGGFDVIKDDELTYDSQRSPFIERVKAMVDMKRRVEDRTGEAKLYFANIIDDLSASLQMAEQAAELGADGVLVSPSAQGFSFVSEVVLRTNLIILSHNSCADGLTRSPVWGVSDAVMARLQRAAGADLAVTPGPFATQYQNTDLSKSFIDACYDSLGDCRSLLPIIQGGKQPAHLASYTEDVGSIDYMIIAATWLDNHKNGIEAGARAFREAWDVLPKQ